MTDDKKPMSGQGKPQRSYEGNRNNSGYGNKGPRSNHSGAASGGRSFGGPKRDDAGRGRSTGDPKTGERRYGKPASPHSGGERRYGKPASPHSGGELRYGKPASPQGGGERRGDRPAYGQSGGDRRSDRPAYGQSGGDRRSDRPAYGQSGGDRRSDRPAYGQSGGGGARSFSKPAYGQSSGGDRRGDRPAYGQGGGERRSDRPAYGQSGGDRRGDRPAYGQSGGDRRSDRPAYGQGGGERRSDRPAYSQSNAGGARSFSKPAFGQPNAGGARRFGMPVPRPTDGEERRYGKPAPRAVPAPVETTGLSISARRVALDVLCDVHKNGAFASLSLDEKLREARLQADDKRLVTNIVYGTLENEIRIDHMLDKLMDHPTHDVVQRDILRMSAYQIMFLDRVPDSAACNEGVNLVKAMRMEAAAGFINAVLRNLVRAKEADTIKEPKREDDLREYLHIMGSMPMWIVDKLIASYGEEEAEKIVMQRNAEHPTVIRPNLTLTTDEEFTKLLEKKEWRFTRGLAPHAFLTYGVADMTFDKDYQDGMFSIQGQSSMLAAQAVDAKAGMKILDACAAPGGKSAYLCESMQMTGRVFAWELHEKRALLLEGVKRRLKLDNLRISVRDATEHRIDMDQTLDAVLLDAPCSGLGVMLQKPDIKQRLKEEDVPAIVQTQKQLLETLSNYVKPGGVFVYSTCSVLPEENTEMIEAFLADHPEYTVEDLPQSFPEAIRDRQTPLGVQLLSSRDGVEGFFIVRMRRKR